jgi:hypothetical protein
LWQIKNTNTILTYNSQFIRGCKNYEIANQLGNVLTTISDRKIATASGTTIAFYSADIITATDYYPFGMTMPGRSYKVAAALEYRYGFNGQEKSNEIFEGSTTALFWEYDSSTGRRWNLDPALIESKSKYSVNSNCPVIVFDKLGSFDSRDEARAYRDKHKLKNVRVRIMQDGYYWLYDKKGKQGWFKDNVSKKVIWTLVFTSTSKIKSPKPAKDMDPYDIGVEWLTGTGPKSRDFKDGDKTVELYKEHDFYKKSYAQTKDILKTWKSGEKLPEQNFKYDLGGFIGILKYIQDASTVATDGLTGNLMFTYLGSHSLFMTVKSIDIDKRVAIVEFIVHNTSTLESGTRIPKIGYHKLYQKTVGKFMNEKVAGRTGPTSETEQVFEISETIQV